jgi:hypothetical protein
MYRQGTRRLRPFSESAQVRCHGCSLPLQRVITDFGADQSFALAMDKVVEHYGVLLNESTIRRVTEQHAQQLYAHHDLPARNADLKTSEVVIVEMDGGMVPLVESDPQAKDRRKGKKLLWKEAKLCLAHPLGSQQLSFGGTLQGDVHEAGRQLSRSAIQAGFGTKTQVHAVGDGAVWIADQVEAQFGSQGRYLLDFYHVCDYLSAAAKSITKNAEAQKAWMDTQKQHLKAQRVVMVLQALLPHMERSDVEESSAPVRQCHRYLSARREQLHYQESLAQGLPIGSGEIESAHRYVVQQRLKRPGAWWRVENAEYMLALRLNRANRQWSNYWNSIARQAA